LPKRYETGDETLERRGLSQRGTGESGEDRNIGPYLPVEERILLAVGPYEWIPGLGRSTGAEDVA
jgi:hypothetical protein